MFLTKCIIFVVSLVALGIVRAIYEDHGETTTLSNIVAVGAGLLGIAFCIMMAVSHWNIMIIPKVALYISICLYVLCKEEFEICEIFWGAIAVTFIIFLITGVVYLNHVERSEDPEISKTTCDLLCVKDGAVNSGSFSGTIIYMHGSSSEKSMYKYYYQQEDGGIKFGSISAEDTTIYFIEDDQKPYLETVVKTYYHMNYNNNPATRCLETSSTTYNLYVPKDSITNVYEFDAE